MAINLGSSPIAEIKLGSTPVEKVFQGTTLVWPFLTTLSGIPPIVMLNALERYVYSLTQTGKCEQNGTPTPDSPVDIMCNNGAIKVGRETYTTPLGRTVYGGTLDVTSGKMVVEKYGIVVDGINHRFTTVSTNYWHITPYDYPAAKVASGTAPALVYSDITSGTSKWGTALSGTQMFTRASDWTGVFNSVDELNALGITVVYELATPQTYQLTPQTVEMIAEWSTFQSNASGNIDITYYANGILKTISGNPVVITDADGQNAEDVTVHIEPIQSGSGTPSPTNIRPISGMTDINITRLGGVVADGTPEVLTVQGKNLLLLLTKSRTANGITITQQTDGGVHISGTATANTDIGLNPMGEAVNYYRIPLPKTGANTYCLSGCPSGGSMSTYRIVGYFDDKDDKYVGVAISDVGTGDSKAVPEGTATIRLMIQVKRGVTIDKVFYPQLELGSTATPYEPYSAQTASVENLLAVGNYKDTQDIISGTVTRKVGIKVLNGTEAFNTSILTNCYSLQDYLAEGTRDGRMVVCSHFWSSDILPASGAREGGAFLGFGGGGYTVGFGATGQFQTADAFKAWLAEQYANGTPVIVLYPLATETTESVTAQPIMAHAGSNTISISPANVSDINLEVKYWTS